MNVNSEFIEGDFVEDVDNVIFDVKGLDHPPTKVIAFPRYVPDERGDRIRKINNRKYAKIYDLNLRYEYVKRFLRKYLVYDEVFDMELCEIPKTDIIRHYKPANKLKELISNIELLDETQRCALKLALILSYKSCVPLKKLGISGSIMVDLHKDDSDIDIIVYGSKESFKVIEVLRELFNEGILRKYSMEEYKRLYVFRKAYKVLDLKAFVKHERRKLFQGMFRNREFFIRFIEDLSGKKPYGYYRYRSLGEITAKARVVDDSHSIFTPVKYIIDNVKIIEVKAKHTISPRNITEIVSFRGRFCQQVFKGENIIVKGKIEAVLENNYLTHYRIVVGGSLKDYLVNEEFVK